LIKIGYKLSTKKLSILSAIQLNNLLLQGNLEMVEYLLETTEPIKTEITFDDYSIYLDDHLNKNNIIFNGDTFKITKQKKIILDDTMNPYTNRITLLHQNKENLRSRHKLYYYKTYIFQIPHLHHHEDTC
jgi:hypothetical protein